MRIKFKPQYMIGIALGCSIILFDIVFSSKGIISKRFLLPLIIIGINIAWLQFWIDFFKELKRQKEIELKFLEFVRSLVENVKSGIPITKSIIQVSTKDFGALSPYIQKLANQIDWGIPIHKALIIFGEDTKNKVIKRAIAIVIEANQSGGNIEEVLESVATSVINIKKMKEERRSSTQSQIVQGYIVYFVFIAIMLVLQLWLFPKISGLGTTLQSGFSMFGGGLGKGGGKPVDLDFIFFMLLIVQGFFAGIMIGKFSEGTLKQGLIHSIVLITLASLIITTAKGGI